MLHAKPVQQPNPEHIRLILHYKNLKTDVTIQPDDNQKTLTSKDIQEITSDIAEYLKSQLPNASHIGTFQDALEVKDDILEGYKEGTVTIGDKFTIPSFKGWKEIVVTEELIKKLIENP